MDFLVCRSCWKNDGRTDERRIEQGEEISFQECTGHRALPSKHSLGPTSVGVPTSQRPLSADQSPSLLRSHRWFPATSRRSRHRRCTSLGGRLRTRMATRDGNRSGPFRPGLSQINVFEAPRLRSPRNRAAHSSRETKRSPRVANRDRHLTDIIIVWVIQMEPLVKKGGLPGLPKLLEERRSDSRTPNSTRAGSSHPSLYRHIARCRQSIHSDPPASACPLPKDHCRPTNRFPARSPRGRQSLDLHKCCSGRSVDTGNRRRCCTPYTRHCRRRSPRRRRASR